MYPLRRFAQRHLGGLTNNKVVTLTYRVRPVWAQRLVAQVFNALIKCDDEK